MKTDTLTDEAWLRLLGERISRYRLDRNLTQAALAREAGVSLPTLQRMEAGRSTQTSNLVRVLRALGLLENIDALVPESPVSPLLQLKLKGRERKRASSSEVKETDGPGWSWGDDE